MDDVARRLEACFAGVFPELTPAEIRQASMASLPAWDSMATVTLLGLIEEEFEIEADLDELGDALSFETIVQYLAGIV
jgi:acyl carrier protein